MDCFSSFSTDIENRYCSSISFWHTFSGRSSLLNNDLTFNSLYPQVDIVLPENMSLKEAHDIGEELQKKIERIPEVERVDFLRSFSFSKDYFFSRHLFISITNLITRRVMNTKWFDMNQQTRVILSLVSFFFAMQLFLIEFFLFICLST